MASEKSTQAGPGFLYTPGLVDVSRSNPEKLFERWVSSQCDTGKVVWWWKNGVGDERYLGVRYEWSKSQPKSQADKDTAEDEYITYPDYILQCDDLTTWVIEIKSVGDPEGGLGDKTHAKARGLAMWQKLMEKHRNDSSSLVELGKVRAGVVVPEELPTGQVLLRIGSPTDWTDPTKENLAQGAGWTPFVLGLREPFCQPTPALTDCATDAPFPRQYQERHDFKAENEKLHSFLPLIPPGHPLIPR
jgi:hypothetical protein